MNLETVSKWVDEKGPDHTDWTTELVDKTITHYSCNGAVFIMVDTGSERTFYFEAVHDIFNLLNDESKVAD